MFHVPEQRFATQIGPHRIEAVKRGTRWIARAHVATKLGPITLIAEADEATVKNAMLKARAFSPMVKDIMRRAQDAVEIGADAVEIGDIWDDARRAIDREVTNIARSTVYQQMAKGLATVTNHPAYNVSMVAVNAIPGYGQLISAGRMGIKMTSAGATMLAEAKAGNPKAQQFVKQTAAAAQAGNPQAQRALATMQALNSAPQLQKGQPNPFAATAQGLAGMGASAAGANAGQSQAWGAVAAQTVNAAYQGAQGGAGNVNYGQLAGSVANATAQQAGATKKQAKAAEDWTSLAANTAASAAKNDGNVDWGQLFGDAAKAIGSTVSAATEGDFVRMPYHVGADRYQAMVAQYEGRHAGRSEIGFDPGRSYGLYCPRA
jgi:hypothetical protein